MASTFSTYRVIQELGGAVENNFRIKTPQNARRKPRFRAPACVRIPENVTSSIFLRCAALFLLYAIFPLRCFTAKDWMGLKQEERSNKLLGGYAKWRDAESRA